VVRGFSRNDGGVNGFGGRLGGIGLVFRRKPCPILVVQLRCIGSGQQPRLEGKRHTRVGIGIDWRRLADAMVEISGAAVSAMDWGCETGGRC
jgi:hypothetical protein